jgi:hypothetical protein
MANPRFIWNANNLDFPDMLSQGTAFRRKSMRSYSFSDGKIAAVARKNTFFEARIVLARFSDATFEAALNAWWAWAVAGNQYAFALDSGKVYNSVNGVQVNPGDTTVTVGSTSGVTAGDTMLIMSSLGLADIHKFVVSGLLTAPPRIQFTGFPSKFTFPTGSIVRHAEYFPKLVALDDDFPVEEELTTWTLDHRCREDAA